MTKMTSKGNNMTIPFNTDSSTTHSGTYTGSSYVSYKGCTHDAVKPVMIGGFPVWLAAHSALDWEVTKNMDLILPLNGAKPKAPFGAFIPMLQVELQDYGGVPNSWPQFIEGVVKYIKSGKKVVAYCVGSHGRTGCFAASLIAVMEPEIEDPIAEIRKRHCSHAVESEKQATAIFALKGLPLPQKYANMGFKSTGYYSGGWSGTAKITNLYTITSVEDKQAYKIYHVARHGSHYGDRFFFVGSKESKYQPDQIVKLTEQ
jgi:hypothetical protein